MVKKGSIHHGKKSRWQSGVSIAAVSVAIIGLLFASVPVALAAQEEPPDEERDRFMFVEHLYQRELHALEGQAMSLEFAGEVSATTEEWMQDLKEQGEDVADLEAALDAFEAGVASAQAFYDTASGLLAAHAGFDDDGQVTDREQAAETVREAGRALRDGHRALRDATVNFRRAVNDWRREHRGQ